MMMKNMRIIVLLMLPLMANAQNLSRTGVAQAKVQNTGAILQHGMVKGYYYFYNLEKKDKHNNNYMLSVVDENLRAVDQVTITRPKNYQLIESSYNGQVFLFMFFDPKGKQVELLSYDNSLKEVGQVKKPIQTTSYNVYQSVALGNSASQRYLVPIQDKGFIQYGPGSIEYFDNSLAKIWDSSAENKRNAATPGEGFQSETMVGSIIANASGGRNSTIIYELLVNDMATGELVFQVEIGTDQYNVSPSDIHYDTARQQIVVFGEYFNKNDKQTNSQSRGFCYLSYDAKGARTDSKVLSWADISQKAPVN